MATSFAGNLFDALISMAKSLHGVGANVDNLELSWTMTAKDYTSIHEPYYLLETSRKGFRIRRIGDDGNKAAVIPSLPMEDAWVARRELNYI